MKEYKEFYGKYTEKGVDFEIWRKWGEGIKDHLECFVNGELFAKTTRYIDVMDFVLYCQYNYIF